MDNKTQNILQKFSTHKVELKEKVQLNRYNFKSFQKEYDNSFTSYRSEKRSALNKAKAAADAHFKDIRDILDRAERSIDEFGSKAEELGVDYRSTKQFQEFQELKRMLLSADSRIKEVQKDISKIM